MASSNSSESTDAKRAAPSRALIIGVVAAIVALAAGMRLWGIGWGLPNALHHYSYHPDENMVFGASLAMFLRGDANPGFYNYGSLYLYMVSFAIMLTTGWGIVTLPKSNLYSHPDVLAPLYMSGRIVAVALGVATVVVVYLLGARQYGRRVGLAAAVILAVTPLHVMHSRFLAVDVPATLLVTLSLLFAVRLYGTRSWRDYLFAGLFAGLAAGTKYNAGLVLVSALTAHTLLWLDSRRENGGVRLVGAGPLVALAACAIGFVVATPGVLTDYPAFARDFAYEVQHARTGHGLLFVNTGSGYLYHLTHSLWAGMSLPLLLLSLAGVGYALKRRTPADLILLSFLVVYYAVIGAAAVRFARYVIPLLPILAIFAARLSVDLLCARSRARRVGVYALLGAMAFYVLFYVALIDRQYALPDRRDDVAHWIRLSLPHGSSIAFPTTPWFYTPPLDPDIALPASAEDRYARAIEVKDYRVVISPPGTEWDVTLLESRHPDMVVISELEYASRERLHDGAYERYMRYLTSHYTEDGMVRCTATITDKALIRRLFAPMAPEDMTYASPTIRVFCRKSSS